MSKAPPSPPPADDPNTDVPARVFDGLFAGTGATLTPELLQALRQAGYDPTAPADFYAVSVWREAVEVLRHHHLPHLERTAGLRELGRRFAEGLGRTTVGRVFRVAAPLLGVDRCLLAVPRYLHVVRRRMRVSVQAEGVNCYRVTAVDRLPSPEFIAGCLQGILDIFSLTGQIDIVAADDAGFELLVRW